MDIVETEEKKILRLEPIVRDGRVWIPGYEKPLPSHNGMARAFWKVFCPCCYGWHDAGPYEGWHPALCFESTIDKYEAGKRIVHAAFDDRGYWVFYGGEWSYVNKARRDIVIKASLEAMKGILSDDQDI